ncbi:MAG: protein translocase subunit SecF [Calditrichia bacterium]|nr:protein translocase subunit SecF [Calditrichia bacterium]
MRFLRNPSYKFMEARKVAFLISGALILVSIISLIMHGGPRYSVDFRGGTFMEIRFEDKADPEKPLNIEIGPVRKVFEEFGLGSAEIKHYGSLQEISIRADITENTDEIFHSLVGQLSKIFPDYNVIEMRKDTVGPKVGKELVVAAMLAILWATVFILLYIMWRFELRFGIGAVAATIHDVVVTIGIFSILDIEISIAIVAALLTIVGYSLNDTIVVFDRIRENLKTMKRQTFDYTNMINRSINETLSRTIITSGTTLLVVLVLYFFGGEVLKDFAFALICGVLIGTYSSIFVASPILVEFEFRKKSS